MPFTRDPFQHPMLDNDDTFLGKLRASKIPKDDLDFHLTALYNHHTGTLKNKSEILLHQETTQDTHGIIKTQFPGELLPPPPPPSITSQANIRHWINPKKESIHSIQGSIVSPHTAATNGGYS
ncbi:protein C1orf194-like isoform X2 [Leptonychotes weddellii]|uniref:Protein C1orf194-like isoform X2 n=1 Tax=Leptonychotes weddellii TaxID=9713 RepID=A0A7F8QYX7_LEPWE|nr:protein C1orf194-like isoform X2 [Leptonychotes weddellii]